MKMPLLPAVAALLFALPMVQVGAGEPAPAIKPVASEIADQSAHVLVTRVVRAGSKLVAVGARGHILLSTDGKTWQQALVPFDRLLTSAFFINESTGWAVGHDAVILHTVDGGKRWEVQNFAPELNQPLLDIRFVDNERGIAVGAYGLFLETWDGGKNWTPVTNAISSESLHLNAIAKLGNGSLVIAGEEGMLAISTDGGTCWTRLQSPYASSMFSIAPKGQNGFVLGGLRGTLFSTDDITTNRWVRIENKTQQSIFGLAPLPSGEYIGAGLNATLVRIGNASAEAIGLKKGADAASSERGAFSDAIAFNGGVVTAGDDGVQYWPIALIR